MNEKALANAKFVVASQACLLLLVHVIVEGVDLVLLCVVVVVVVLPCNSATYLRKKSSSYYLATPTRVYCYCTQHIYYLP